MLLVAKQILIMSFLIYRLLCEKMSSVDNYLWKLSQISSHCYKWFQENNEAKYVRKTE